MVIFTQFDCNPRWKTCYGVDTMKTLLLAVLTAAAAFGEDKADLAAINRIKTEAFEHSKVMDHAFYLTDVYGPRLTGSPGLKAAAEWAVKQFTTWGLDGANLETWGPF